MLKIKTKSITRNDWTDIEKKRYVYQVRPFPAFPGAVSLIQMQKVRKPIVAHSCGKCVTFADNGFYWVQLAPEKENWWLTAMADPLKRPVQYYFDITSENRIGENAAEFDDIFLDIVALPDGTCELLDKNELDEALSKQIISESQYNLSLQTASSLLISIPSRIQELNRFVVSCICELENQLKSE